MRKVVASVLLLCLAALPALAAEETKGKRHDVTVQFVSFDAQAKTVTFKDDKGEQKTAPVMDAALAGFKTLKAGEKIVLTCADNEMGEHQAIAMVKPAMVKHG